MATIKKLKYKLAIMDASTGKIFIKNVPKGKNTSEEIEEYIQEVLGFRLSDATWQIGDIEILCD